MSAPADETRRIPPPDDPDDPHDPHDIGEPEGPGDESLGATVPLPGRDLTAGRSAQSGKSMHAERMDKLARERSDTHLRYELRGEIGHGGMGAVYEVWDTDLRRSLAMKVILGDTGSQLGTTGAQDEALVRFLEEAQVSAQLDHPGVVPVHELGVDSEGRVYFTMRFVKGRNLREIIADVHAGREGWTLTRALGAIVKVCETMAFAHAKGVVHRDLKPANVMVGRYGEVYVMDWGLASAKGRERYAADIRLQRDASVSLTEIRTDRREAGEELDSPLMTMDGAVIGTPAYMSPEQAKGQVEDVGPPSDVYAVGALLYQLLTGQMPYVEPGARISAHTVLALVISGPPKPVHELAPEIPAELCAICEKAMARETAERYASIGDFADDLHAYLDNRVVTAYRTGAWVEFRKWVQRNKALAASMAAAIAVALLGLGAFLWQEKRRAEEEFLAADVFRYRYYLEEAQELWPPGEDMVPELEAWLDKARAVTDRLEVHEGRLEAFRDEHAAAASADWVFDDADLQSEHDGLADLVAGLRAFRGSDPSASVLADVEQRLDYARGVRRRTIEEHREAWDRAIASIRDEAECPLYTGLEITPQVGLVPIGRSPESGLWEFGHPLSGEVPAPDSRGELSVAESTGLVFVLIPGGTFAMGAEQGEPGAPNVDPETSFWEQPVHEVELLPFFLSKYEMTQGQWGRLTYANPSSYPPGVEVGGKHMTLAHPVESVSWIDCDELMRNRGLALPTEAQWELAVRAGSTTVFSGGDDRESLRGMANLADQTAGSVGAVWHEIDLWDREGSGRRPLEDGWPVHSPVDAFPPNAFGLHGMHGNVFEWCRDMRGSYQDDPPREGDGLRHARELRSQAYRICRSSSFRHSWRKARSAARYWEQSKWASNFTGLRPSRPLDP